MAHSAKPCLVLLLSFAAAITTAAESWDLVGVIPPCADTGGVQPCVPDLTGALTCPNVALTIITAAEKEKHADAFKHSDPKDETDPNWSARYPTMVLRSCGVVGAAAELTAVQSAQMQGDAAAKQKFMEIICNGDNAPKIEPYACATNLATMGRVFHKCTCPPTARRDSAETFVE